MKTIRIKIYKFTELNPNAQEVAIQKQREDLDFQYIWDEARETVEKFNNIFGVTESNRNWLEFRTSNIENNFLALSGLRLRKYIINNFWGDLFTRKFYNSFGDNKVVRHPCVKNNFYNMDKGARVNSSNFYYSRIQFNTDCPLTGVTYDLDILEPIYDFLLKPDNSNFEDLLNQCFASLKKSIDNEIEYQESDEAIREYLKEQDLNYTKDGNEYFG